MFSGSASFIIVGADFSTRRAPGRRAEIALCVPGDALGLKRERWPIGGKPAVGVYSRRGNQIGYIWPADAELVFGLVDQARAIFQGAESIGAIVRLTFDGSLPALALPKPKPRLIIPPREPRDDYCEIFPPTRSAAHWEGRASGRLGDVGPRP
jgi:hypothetical protein